MEYSKRLPYEIRKKLKILLGEEVKGSTYSRSVIFIYSNTVSN